MIANDTAATREFDDPDRTILVLCFPEIGERLAPWRDEEAAPGFPTHITVLTPFLAETRLDGQARADLRGICASIPSFEVRLVSVERLTAITCLALEDESGPRALLAALRERWPEFVPYNGLRGEDPTPHLTLVWPEGPEERHAKVAAEVKVLLPLSERATALTLLARKAHRWTTIAEFPLG